MKLKILLGVFLLTIFYSLFPASAAHAQVTRPQNYLNTNPDVPINQHSYVQTLFIDIASAISCQLAGIDPVNPSAKCLGIDPKTNKIGFVEGGGGAIGMMGGLISMTFYIPVSTHDYGAYLASNFGIAKQTYAQEDGIGYKSLLPTLKMWQAFRNMTYLLLVILFIIVGLGIMFRIKIDPRTVMTIQNQIPKLIIAIVFITFSYAIAGFLIDLMYVAIYLIVRLFAETGINPTDTLKSSPFGAVGGFGGMTGIANGVSDSVAGIVASIFEGTTGSIVAALVTGILGGMLGGVASSVFGPIGAVLGPAAGMLIGTTAGFFFGGEILGLFARIIVYIVVIVAIFAALLRLWFQLIKCYVYVLINTVLAPFYIAQGLIPGKSGVGSWLRSMVANLSVFPVTITMFLLGKTFTDGFKDAIHSGVVPFAPPLVGEYSPDRFASIIGLGIILMTPEVVNIVRDALKAPEFKFAGAIGKSISAGAGFTTGSVRETLGTVRTFTSGTPKPGEKGLPGVFGRIFH